ncbi:MAG: thiamine diphosphokinase [Coriobacteriia bacterium]|nr:thiamine diphosphokinase [Coriobacteriia bacterium]
MNEHALIVGAAPHPGARSFYRELLGGFDIIVACDAAAEWCIDLGRVPDVAVGDFDSARPGAIERLASAGVRVAAYPRDKDDTDLDLAASEVLSLGVGSVAFTAAFTGRLDHTLAALGTARRCAALAPVILEPAYIAWVLAPEGRVRVSFDAPAGAVFSVVAIEAVPGLCVTGGRYAAAGLDVPPFSSRTISNEALGGRVEVSLDEGATLVVLHRSAENRI